jgi:cyclophilin family peptidyl-prolyl cis-trans isomerase
MELKKDVVPKTAENFLQLCTSTTPGFGYAAQQVILKSQYCGPDKASLIL